MEKKGEVYCFVEHRNDLKNIKKILLETQKILKNKEYSRLTNLSDGTIHSATVNQDSLNIVIAVLIYSLSKIFHRKNYFLMDGWNDFNDILMKNLNLMISSSDCNYILERAGEIRHSLNKIDGNLGIYIKDVFRKAEINKAFKIYEHGPSSKKTADLLGISLWDFASYIGQSNISESNIFVTMPEKERLKYAEEFFK